MASARVMLIGKLLGMFAIYSVWVLIALGICFGLAEAILPENLAPLVAIPAYIVLIMLPLWVFNRVTSKPPAWIEKVKAEGKPATATIVHVADSGITINRTREILLVQMHIQPADGSDPYEVIQQKQVSWFGGYGSLSEGSRFPVKYDPNHKKHIVVLDHASSYNKPHYDYSNQNARRDPGNSGSQRASNNAYSQHTADGHDSGSAGSEMARNLSELSHLHKSGELSDAEFEAAKKKLLGQ